MGKEILDPGKHNLPDGLFELLEIKRKLWRAEVIDLGVMIAAVLIGSTEKAMIFSGLHPLKDSLSMIAEMAPDYLILASWSVWIGREIQSFNINNKIITR